jgi:hypothetical protein
LQFHHIFPKAVLNGRYTPAQINEIGNLAFISGKTNRGISAKPPSEYLPGVLEKQGEKSLTAQCVPTDPALWTLDRFPEFLAERHRLLSARVNDFLGAVPESFH